MSSKTTAVRPTITVADRLVLPTGVTITAFDSSTQGDSYRVELADGRHFQINQRLYNLLDLLHAPATMAELAERFYQRTNEQIPADQLETLCIQLLTQNLLRIDGQPQPPVKPVTPKAYLGMHFRRTVLSTAWLAPIARLFQGFFHWQLAVPVIIILVISHVLAYRELSLQPDLKFELFTGPLLTISLLFSIFLHELGHVAACHRWNCPHGPLGFGLYFSMPVFYVDVTQAWRLNRRQRAVVDIGGVYIQMLCVPLALLLYWWTANATFLIVIMTLDMLVLYNFEPFMKLDGYWLLSDLTGVANLHTRTKEAALLIVQRLWQRITGKRSPVTSSPFGHWPRWVQAIIWVYLVISAVIWPLFMLFWLPMLWESLLTYPALLQTAVATLFTAVGQGDMGTTLAQISALFMPTLILVGLGFELKRMGSKVLTGFNNRHSQVSTEQAAAASA